MIDEYEVADVKFIIHIEIRKKPTWIMLLRKFFMELAEFMKPMNRRQTKGLRRNEGKRGHKWISNRNNSSIR